MKHTMFLHCEIQILIHRTMPNIPYDIGTQSSLKIVTDIYMQEVKDVCLGAENQNTFS